MHPNTVNLVVRIIGAIAIVSVLSLVLLAFTGAQTDASRTGLVSIATGCIGALGGILATSK